MNNEKRELTMDELNIVAGGFNAQEHGALQQPSKHLNRGTANRGTSDRGSGNQ